MRYKTEQGMSGNVYAITYPNDSIFLGDNNFIKVENFAETRFGVSISVFDNYNGETKQLFYRTDLNSMKFDLNTTLKAIYMEGGLNTLDIGVTIYAGNLNTVDAEFSFTTDLLNGKSYTSESHACERVIYTYTDDDLEFCEMFFPASGELTVDGNPNVITVLKGFNTVDFSDFITSDGEYTIQYVAEAARPTVTISGIQEGTYSAVATLSITDQSGTVPSNEKKGGIWSDSEFVPDSYTIRLIHNTICEDNNIVRIDYTNADGCSRHLAGKLLEEGTSTEYTDYERFDTSVYRNIPYHLMTGMSQTIKIGFDSLDRLSYWNHALLSEKCWFTNYNYDQYPCIIATSKVTKNADAQQDVELEVRLIHN